MDLILVLLSLASRPVLASQLASATKRDGTSTRHTLARLERDGLAERVRVGSRGPIGTYAWRATDAGRAAAQPAIEFMRGGGSA